MARDRLAGVKAPVRPALGSLKQALRWTYYRSEQIEVGYYLKIPVLDKLGVMAKLSDVLQQRGISIEAIIQKESEILKSYIFVILTQVVREQELNAALDALAELDEVTGPVTRIQLSPLMESVACQYSEIYQYPWRRDAAVIRAGVADRFGPGWRVVCPRRVAVFQSGADCLVA